LIIEVAQRILLKENINLTKLCVPRGELKYGIWYGIANPTTHLPGEPFFSYLWHHKIEDKR